MSGCVEPPLCCILISSPARRPSDVTISAICAKLQPVDQLDLPVPARVSEQEQVPVGFIQHKLYDDTWHGVMSKHRDQVITEAPQRSERLITRVEDDAVADGRYRLLGLVAALSLVLAMVASTLESPRNQDLVLIEGTAHELEASWQLFITWN